jgi:acetaldehyde dehydrogenase
MRVAIIGTGRIGTHLLYKLLDVGPTKYDVVAFVGRRENTKKLPPNVPYYSTGIQYFIDNLNVCDVVFDCTDAATATNNAEIFSKQNIFVIDLTPSNVGDICVPHVNCDCLEHTRNVNMITCGGQVSIPLLKYITSKYEVKYAEVVTQISSDSAGMATRINVDKYIQTTENAIKILTGIDTCKVILNVNPSPEIVMQTTLFVETSGEMITTVDYDDFIKSMQIYVSGYTSEVKPTYISDTILMVSVKVYGSFGQPGNLDVINCAAMEVANLRIARA